MHPRAISWLIALTLSSLSIAIIVQSSNRPMEALNPPSLDDGTIALASLGDSDVVSVRAEIIEEKDGEAEMVVYSTTSADTAEDLPQAVTMELPGGETVTVLGSDLALGRRFRVSAATADHYRASSPQDAAGPMPSPDVFEALTLDLEMQREAVQQRILLRDMGSAEAPEERQRPEETALSALALTLTPGPYRFADPGGWEIPIYVVARRRLEDSGDLAATPVPQAMSILVEAPGTEPRTVTIEEGRTRSTGAVVVPLRRESDLEITATDLAGNATAAGLVLSWQRHGPKSLALRVFPPTTDGYATRHSPIHLHAHVELDEQRLQPGRALPLRTSSSKKLSVEPTEAALGADGAPVTLTVRGHEDGRETLTLQMPDLDLETDVSLSFRRPYLFLGLATLCGIVGVLVARRSQLFEQSKRAVALELLAAATGGVLLYAAFLMQWLPAPGFLIGALPAAAVGILGGYAGEAVFQGLLKLVGIDE